MGPPSRPTADKPTDMNELSDVLLGSGIDLREEEAALLNQNNTMYQPQPDQYYGSHLPDSFDSTTFNVSAPDRSNVLSQNIPGDKKSFYGAGTFNQPAAPHQPVARLAEDERKAALQRKAEHRQYHLNNPFLYAGPMQKRLVKQSYTQQVSIPRSKMFTSANSQPVQVAVSGPDKQERIVLLTGQDLIHDDAPIAEILTLLSLATEERLRTFIEDAAALAKGRRIGSHGIVPADLASLAVGEGTFETVNTLPTPSNSAVSPKSNPLKRMLNNGWLSGLTRLSFNRFLCCYE